MITNYINKFKINVSGYEIPKQLFLETSNICNANCIFCAYQLDERAKEIMSFDMFKKIVKEYKNIGGESINLTPYAGEVLLDKDFILKVNYIRDLGFKNIATYTNLNFLDKFDIDNFLESGLTDLAISIAPLEKEVYKSIFKIDGFDRVFKNLIKLLENFHKNKNKTIKKINISFRSNIDMEEIKKNNNFKKISQYIKDGVITSNMKVFDSWMGVIKEDDLLDGMTFKSPDFEKPVPCDRLFMLKIHSDGTMRACGCRYDYTSNKDNFAIGHYSDKNLIDAYNSNTVKKLKKSFYDKSIPIECKECAWYENFRYKGKN